jgi:steroid 5-alpha reductase family enzyme
MHREGFLRAGYFLVVSAVFLAVIVGASLLGGHLLRPYGLFTEYHELVQLAIWENIFLNVAGWLVCILFFRSDCWTFDSMGWPTSPVYAALFFANAVGNTQRQQFVLLLSCLYCVRLNGNYFRSEGWGFIGLEDWRYVDIRRQLAARGIGWVIPSFFLVYISQWVMVFLATAPIYYIMRDTSAFGPRDGLCAALMLSGIVLEFLADSHLQNFIAFEKKPGTILQTGLWALSRHPNYLGQCIVWLGLGLWGLNSDSGWLIFLGSCNIIGLVVFYSVDAMEKRMLETPSRRRIFSEYQRTTSKLLLWPSS